MSLKYYQGPEWSAWILEQAAEDTLAKTRMYNADADVWRILRPEDLGMATVPVGGVGNKQYFFAVVLPALTITAVIVFRVPSGIGITFMGFAMSTHIGQGAVYEVDVNMVKRQEAPIRLLKGKNIAWDDTGVVPVGATGVWHINAILLEQFVFVRQNDLVSINLFVKYEFSGQIEMWPIAVNRSSYAKVSGFAGNRKGLALTGLTVETITRRRVVACDSVRPHSITLFF